tara:strand:- start:3055 stop:3336 length:282 start_codon:yes stop_codon:yes gene_type:complete
MEKEDLVEMLKIRKEFRDNNISKNSLKEKYSKFCEKFEHSFDMITNPNCDDTMLNKLLNAHMAVKNGSMSQHDASVRVGQELVDTYVKPQLEK